MAAKISIKISYRVLGSLWNTTSVRCDVKHKITCRVHRHGCRCLRIARMPSIARLKTGVLDNSVVDGPSSQGRKGRTRRVSSAEGREWCGALDLSFRAWGNAGIGSRLGSTGVSPSKGDPFACKAQLEVDINLHKRPLMVSCRCRKPY